MKVNVITGTYLETNNYIIENNNQCIFVDCSALLENFEFVVKSKPVAILLTHAHWDHFMTIVAVSKKYDIPVYMSKEAIQNMGEREHFIGDKNIIVKPEDLESIFVEDGEVISLCGLNIKVIKTPGHTNCGMSYLIENCLFCGDTIFADGGIGRTDLPTSSYEELQNSLNIILSLPPNIVLYPGHGPESTIETELDYYED